MPNLGNAYSEINDVQYAFENYRILRHKSDCAANFNNVSKAGYDIYNVAGRK